MTLLEKINAECKKQQIDIKTLELKAGIGNGSISKWVTSVPKVDTLYKVANCLGVTLDYLYSGSSLENSVSEQQEFISLYKNLSETGQDLCMEYIKGYAKAEGYYKQFVKSDNPICYPNKFTTKTFFSGSHAEYVIFQILSEIINTEYFKILPHVSLCDMFQYNIPEQTNIYKFLGYHADFVIFDKAYYPVLAIEINGSKHYEDKKSMWTDTQKKAFFEYHKIPFIESNWSKKIDNAKEYIINELQEITLPVYCWECGHIMERKTNTKDNKLFYSCYNSKEHTNNMPRTLSWDSIPALLNII